MNLQVYENLLLSESSVKTLSARRPNREDNRARIWPQFAVDSLIFAIDALAPLVPFLGFKA
jgi:hypothetical protein